MTKLEAWNIWCEQNGSKIGGGEYTLKMSSHGKAFSAAWNTAVEVCCRMVEEGTDEPMQVDTLKIITTERSRIATKINGLKS